ncbi:hypothetical protein [Campylobacter mucosalis]|uniref:Uncharacterized protein n=1 Tax=Campylobacter mucosalis CCUG 21559 TaxID=1032067 RepID=A0A6G5QFN6_9BACT|nr:hypothetical protein [Campylobacter mucosalis]QCD44461.1 hypothetical protein CMUC_0662 [Campylobacter mucosalis CCUG 21559]
MVKFKFKKVPRCKICSSKLDEKGNCTWDECPINMAKRIKEQETNKQGGTNEANNKTETTNS